ncbi:hypothetical protein OXPF_30500 [Oxobacter pfennigii]|uniref:Protein kinase n=1 Tax=Oxobacter pfennigii TaxID=36849 RepID=A0A0P8Y9P7_9CLOT|nr:hypothetical protein [Oxobacter pfennigii]KPU43609.1 hypothetical protein OXPF_30500 [Oxobacter pfennigii]
MDKKSGYKNLAEKFNIDLRECKFLGEGHNGIVYLLPDGKIIKIFKKIKNCESEYSILEAVRGSKYFPKVYGSMGNYIIRDYVGGECLKDYIKRNGLDKKVAKNLINLIEEFKKLNFKKLDIRCKDIYVQKDKSLMVIDPKYSFTREKSFPKHLSKGLSKLGVLGDFLEVVRIEKPQVYEEWTGKLIESGIL